MQGCRNRRDGTTTRFTNNVLFPEPQRFFIICICHLLPIHPFSSEGFRSFNIQKFLLRQKLWIMDTIKLSRNVSIRLFIPPECINHPLLHTTTSSKDCGPGHTQREVPESLTRSVNTAVPPIWGGKCSKTLSGCQKLQLVLDLPIHTHLWENLIYKLGTVRDKQQQLIIK